MDTSQVDASVQDTLTGAGETQDGSTGNQQQGQVQSQQTQAQAQTQVEQDDFDKPRAMALIEKLRPFEQKATKLEREKAELEAKVKAFEDEKLTDDERKEKKLKELEAKETAWADERKQLQLQMALERTPNVKYADLVLMKLNQAEIEYDEKGAPTKVSIEAQIKTLETDYPDLFKQEDAQGQGQGGAKGHTAGSSTNTGRGNASNFFYEDQIADPAFWGEHRDEIMVAMREGRIRPARNQG
jgi:hypothetical protein